MARGPYVLVNVRGTIADGLFCVRSKEPEPLCMIYNPIENDHEGRQSSRRRGLCGRIRRNAHVSLPVAFDTTRLYVLGEGTYKPDQNFCKHFLDRHGVTGIPAVNLGQRQARLQEVVQYGEQPGPRRRLRVGQSKALSHSREGDNQSEIRSEHQIPQQVSHQRTLP